MFITLMAAFFVITGCEKSGNVDPVYQKGLDVIYPNAKHVEWEYDDGYLTAEFLYDGMEIKVWFDDNGNWLCIDADMPFRKLPQNIQDAFDNCEYSDWKIDDIDYMQIRNNPAVQDILSFYEFDVEKGEREKEFVIYPDGNVGNKLNYLKFK